MEKPNFRMSKRKHSSSDKGNISFNEQMNKRNKSSDAGYFNKYNVRLLNNMVNSFDDFQNIYKVVAKKSGSSITYDYDVQIVHSGSRYCCKRFLGICVDHCRDPDWYTYDGKNVAGTNNHLNLKSINFNNNYDTSKAYNDSVFHSSFSFLCNQCNGLSIQWRSPPISR